MTRPVAPVLPLPDLASGPTHRLQLTDPATQLVILAWIGEAVKVVNDNLPGHHLTLAGVLTALGAVAYTTVTVAMKHALAGRLAAAQLARATPAPPIVVTGP